MTANDAGGAASLFAFGISGANTATPFDPHGGIPAADGTVATTPYNLAITTTNANDFIIGVVDGSSATSYTANAPNTQIDMYSTVPYAAVEYDIVSSAGTQTVSWAGANAGTAMIADAVQLLGASTTSVICVPSSVAMGSHSTCTATVTGSSPTGTVTWSQSGSGSVTFSASTCGLSSGACSVTATGLSAGSVTVQGAYGGDSGNGASSGTFSLAVTTPTLTVTPSQGPTGATTTLSGGSYSPFYIYNYCYKANTGSPSVCSSASQFLTDGSGNIPSGVSLTTSGASNGLVVVSDPAGAGTVIAFATFTITTPAISLVPTSSAAGSSVIVTGSGFSVSTAIGTFTFAGSTPGTQTCTSQITSATGAFACTFTVPSDVPGPYTVTAAGSDVGSVSADTASGTFTIPALPASTTTVVCSPSSVALGSPSTCTATVTGSSPTGTITWSQTSTNGGSVTFSASTCALSSGSCFVTATGLSAGSVLVLGAYGGDGSNAPSSGTFSLAVTTPTLTITPTRGPTGATTSLSGGSYSQSYTYNYCYEASTLTPSGCSSAHQLTTDSSGNIPGGKSLTTSGASNGLVVVSDPTSSSVITSATFTITTPAISLVPTSSAVGSSVLVTGSGFSVSTAIGTFTFAGSTPATQTCTSQTTSSVGAFVCNFTVPSDVAGPYTVTASGSDVGSVSADTASATFTITALPATTTSINCVPSSVAVGSHSTCTATVAGASPTGTITWSQTTLNGGSVTFSASTCALSSGACSVTATGVSAGSVPVLGAYGGDGGNAPSSGTFSLAVTTPTLAITPSRGPTGVTTTLSGGGYSYSYTYNYCYKANTGSPSVCSSALQFTTDASGNIPSGKSVTTSGASNGLVVVSDPTSSSVIALATFTITTPAISLVLTHGAVGSSVLVTGSGFSVSTAIGTFTFAGSTPATQTCTSQITSSAGAFSCTFTVPSSSVGAHTVTASGSDVGSVSADTASSTFTVDALPATTTSVVCSPSSVAVGSHSTCTATATGSFPTGTITWSQASLNGGSVTFSSSACALSSGSCSVTATGVSAGSVIVDGVYGGDGSNAASSGTFSLAVTNPASVPEFPVALAMPILFLLAAAIYLLAKSKVLLPKEKVGRVG